MTLYLATTNTNKKKEILNLFKSHRSPKEIELLAIDDIVTQGLNMKKGLEFNVEETGSSFMENADIKAEALSKIISEKKIIAEDSGLVVDQLGGKPGILSSRYASNDAERIQRVLDELRDFSDICQRKAFFFTSLCYMDEKKNKIFFHGKVEGLILREPKGEHGFGYDPIFYLPRLGKTFSELVFKEKQSYSHRSYAFFRFLNFIDRKND